MQNKIITTTDKTVHSIKISDIKINGRELDSKKQDVNKLKKSIKDNNELFTPITIDLDNNLVMGYNRYIACKELKLEEIPAFITTETNPDKLKLMEIDENIVRKELTSFQKMKLHGLRKEAYEEIYPTSTKEFKSANNAKPAEDREETVVGFVEATANEENCSEKTIQNDIKRYNNINDNCPELLESLAKADKRAASKGVELEKISKMTAEEMSKLSNEIDEKLENNEDVSITDLILNPTPVIEDKIKDDYKLVFQLDLYNYINNKPQYKKLQDTLKFDMKKATELKKKFKDDFTNEIKLILTNI